MGYCYGDTIKEYGIGEEYSTLRGDKFVRQNILTGKYDRCRQYFENLQWER
jgi:hypothetical protein